MPTKIHDGDGSCFMSSFSHDFAKMFDKPDGDIGARWVWGGLWKALVQGGVPTRRFQGRVRCFFVPTEVAVCKLSRALVCLCFGYRSLMCSTWTTTFRSV